MKVKSESEVAQLYPTLSEPMDCSLPGSSIHGIFQARVLEWGAIAFSVLLAAIDQILTLKISLEITVLRWQKHSPIEFLNPTEFSTLHHRNFKI